MRFRPVLFVGLGRYGCEIAQRISTTIREANPEAAPVVALVEIHDDGTVIHETAEAGDGPPVHIKLAEAKTFAARFDAIAAEEQALARVFVRIVDGLHQRRINQILEEGGTLVDQRTSVYFVAPLCDDVGSTALIALIEIFNRLVTTRLAGQELHRTVLGFFPDLFADFRDSDERYARSYVCLQELELIAEDVEQTLPFDFVYLFTAKNEENQDIGSHEDLALALGETLSLVLRKEIARDISFGSVTVNRDTYGAITRYSSLGTSKLILPRQEICRALDGHFAATVLGELGVGDDQRIDRQDISSDVRTFIYDTHLLDVEQDLAKNTDDQRIWEPYRTSLRENTALMQVDDILAQIAADNDEYEKQEVTRMMREIRLRYMYLAGLHKANLENEHGKQMDHGLLRAEAFLDVFLNKRGEATTGDVIDAGITIEDVDRKARTFFDELCGIDRKQQATLQQEIISKEIALQQHEAEKKAREAAGPASDPAVPDTKALETVIAKTVKELEEKQKQHDQLREISATHDRQLHDGSYRRALLLRERSKAEEAAAQLTEELRKADQDWRVKRAAMTEEKQRGWAALLKAGVIATGLFILYVVIALVLYQKSAVEARLLRKIGGGISVALIIYLIVVAVQAAIRWRAAKARLYLAAQRKASVSLSIAGKHGSAFRTVYDFGVHGASIDWATQFREAGDHLNDDFRAFRAALRSLHETERNAYDQVQFTQTLFRRSVVATSDIEEFIDGASRYDTEKNRFRADHPLSGEFAAFVTARDLQHLLRGLRDTSAEVFAHIRILTIEKLLLDREAEKRLSVAEKLQQLFRYGAPMVQLRVERGEDKAQPVRYFGTARADSSLIETVKHIGQDAHSYRSGIDTEMTVVTIKAGFPAHHVALVVHCDFVMQQQKDPVRLRVVPDWTLQPLIPSELMLGNENDAARQLACESLALGVVTETPDGLVMDGIVIGTSYRALVDLLRSLRGAGLKAKLQVKRDEQLAEKDAYEKLSEFLSKRQGDTIDQRIIQRALDRLDEPASI